ncbi:dipeptidase [Gaetbulibacter aestuarii]
MASCKQSSEKNSETYKTIHNRAIVIDTHNDILMKVLEDGVKFDDDLTGITHSDLDRWKRGGLDVQVFSVYCDGTAKNAYDYANRQIDWLDAVVNRNPSKIMKVFNASELLSAVKTGKIAAIIGVEGGHMIENDLDKLDSLYQRGARYLTLTHNTSADWVSSCVDQTERPEIPKGLTDFGKAVIKRMNNLGMLVDVSHAGEQSFWDAINTSTKPVFASHSSVYSLCPHPRNLKDDQIKAIAKKGGVIQINFNPGFVDASFEKKEQDFLEKHKTEHDSLMASLQDEWLVKFQLYKTYADEAEPIRPPLFKVIDHIDYIVNLVGADYVGIGSDFDGITLTPKELDDVTAYPNITRALVERGYSEADIDKILGENFIRVLKANENN